MIRRLGEQKLWGCEKQGSVGKEQRYSPQGMSLCYFFQLEALSWDGERWPSASPAHPVSRADTASRSQQLTSVRGLLPLLTSACPVAPTNQSKLALKILGQRGDRTGAQRSP